MEEVLNRLLAPALAIFMIGSLLEMGLKLELRQAGRALRDTRFVVAALLWSFAVGPALAFVLAKLLPLAPPYGLGLILLGLAPGAPFLPMIAGRARTDLNYVAAFMLLAAIGTMIVMPVLVPMVAADLSADRWAIARPLLLFVAVPLVGGAILRLASAGFADSAHPFVRTVTSIDIVAMLGIVLVLYWRDFAGALGSYAIGAQILYYVLLAAAAHAINFGLSSQKSSAIVLGVCTRNVGAAIAPVMTATGADQRATVMCVLAVFITLALGFAVAALLPQSTRPAREAG